MHSDAELDHLSELLAALPTSNELSIDEEFPMSLGKFDGYVAGVITCPDLIPPSEWFNGVFGDGGDIPLDDIEEVQALFEALTAHYNRVARVLAERPEDYQPVYEVDRNEPDEPLWEPWISGFERAMRMRPDAWECIVESDDDEAAASVNMILHMADVNANTSQYDEEKVEELDRIGAGLLPQLAIALNAWTKARPPSRIRPSTDEWNDAGPMQPLQGRKVGRNEPCPCGSGRKYKRCCGAN